MTNIFAENITWSIGIVISLFVIIAAHRLVLFRQKRNKIVEASEKFRNKILAELVGLYPVTQYWDKETYPRFIQSVPKIESAAAEFRYFIKSKVSFDAAVKKYCEYCKHITWDEVAAYSMYPSMRKPGEIGPRERFEEIVDNLLSFAKEK